MPVAMTTELYWLVLTTVMTGMLWIPYIVNRVMELGPPPMTWYPLPDPSPKAPWAARAVKAHMNAVENLAIFAPLVLAVHITNSGSSVTASACASYFFARVAHYAIGLFGVPVPFRTLAFLVGFLAQMTLGVALLGLL